MCLHYLSFKAIRISILVAGRNESCAFHQVCDLWLVILYMFKGVFMKYMHSECTWVCQSLTRKWTVLEDLADGNGSARAEEQRTMSQYRGEQPLGINFHPYLRWTPINKATPYPLSWCYQRYLSCSGIVHTKSEALEKVWLLLRTSGSRKGMGSCFGFSFSPPFIHL